MDAKKSNWKYKKSLIFYKVFFGWKVEFTIPWDKIHFCNGTFRLALTRFLVRKNTCEFSSCPEVPVTDDTLFRLGIGYHRLQYMLTFRRS